jgi:hypothetical protein
MNQRLINLALAQIQLDVEAGDMTAIEELLRSVPLENLEGFLSEAVEYDEGHDGQPDEAQEWADFDPEC